MIDACDGVVVELAQTPTQGTLLSVVELLHASTHPVLVTDASGLVGVCGSAQIVAALSRHHNPTPITASA